MNIEIKDKFILVGGCNLSQFGPEDFKKVCSDYERKTIVLHGGKELEESLSFIENNFKNDYFVQLGFTASKSNIKVNSYNEKSLLKQKEYTSNLDAFRDIEVSYLNEKNEKWFNYLPEYIHQDNLDYLRNETNVSRTFSLSDQANQVIATLMTFDSTFYTGKAIDQVGWIWIKRGISKEQRKEAHYKISKWLKENLTKDLFQAGIHIENYRSQSFFKNIGFTVQCAHITQR